MKKRKSEQLLKLEQAVISLLDRIYKHTQKCIQSKQKYGGCLVCPKYSSIKFPSPEIQAEFERRATEYFNDKNVCGYYLKYLTPPILPKVDNKQNSNTADDYKIIFELPQFDEEWETITLAEELIYCPANGEESGGIDWFEIQREAIRLTPLLHQSLKETKIIYMINAKLEQLGLPEFESFIYKYAIDDLNFPKMYKHEIEKWKKGNVDWKKRYHLIAKLFSPNHTLRDTYIIAHQKATESRNNTLKDLLWGYISHIENHLILQTSLPDEKKKKQLTLLRKFKKRTIKKEKYVAKRPAICISSFECGQVLYFLMHKFFSQKRKSIVLAESLIYIWVAQHAAFSDLNLNVENILGITTSSINIESLVIKTHRGDIYLTQGLMDVLKTYFNFLKKESSEKLFQKLSYDNLEDILSKYTEELFGTENKLFPKDFLEKAHVNPGVRITLDLRRKITNQEILIKNSPYRIKSQEIKKLIKNAIIKNNSLLQ
jgi:hypothetical protein